MNPQEFTKSRQPKNLHAVFKILMRPSKNPILEFCITLKVSFRLQEASNDNRSMKNGKMEEPDYDLKVRQKTWIQLIMMAMEEDIIKHSPKCANKYCEKVQPQNPKLSGWDRRSRSGKRKWLCNTCISAYDSKQFCEF